MKILYIENHEIFAETVKTRFLSSHFVKVVPNLTAAREEIANETFDLLLVDYDLDGGKGDELIRELRVHQNNILIIGVSSRIEGNEALKNAGANAICDKMEFDRIQDLIDNINLK